MHLVARVNWFLGENGLSALLADLKACGSCESSAKTEQISGSFKSADSVAEQSFNLNQKIPSDIFYGAYCYKCFFFLFSFAQHGSTFLSNLISG